MAWIIHAPRKDRLTNEGTMMFKVQSFSSFRTLNIEL